MKTIQKAFIIDDDAIYQFTLKKEIEATTMVSSLQCFTNGETAINYLKTINDNIKEVPDLIFLDINMPIMDGWEFLDCLISFKSKLTKNITVFVLSSSDDMKDIEKSKKYTEVKEYIVKPIMRDKLKVVLQKYF